MSFSAKLSKFNEAVHEGRYWQVTVRGGEEVEKGLVYQLVLNGAGLVLEEAVCVKFCQTSCVKFCQTSCVVHILRWQCEFVSTPCARDADSDGEEERKRDRKRGRRSILFAEKQGLFRKYLSLSSADWEQVIKWPLSWNAKNHTTSVACSRVRSSSLTMNSGKVGSLAAVHPDPEQGPWRHAHAHRCSTACSDTIDPQSE